MPTIILEDPESSKDDKRYALFSTISDTFLGFGLTRAEIADFYAEMRRQEILDDIQRREDLLAETGNDYWIHNEPFSEYLKQHLVGNCCNKEINAEVKRRKKKVRDELREAAINKLYPRCPECGNTLDNATPDGSPHLRRCANCKSVWEPNNV